jgi:hypothetical protein
MTTPRNSQLSLISVQGPPIVPAAASQMALISVQGPPFAPSEISQFALVIVSANGKRNQTLGPALQLSCWTPCANLAYNGE